MLVCRATKSRPIAPISAGNANRTLKQVATIVQLNTGTRSMVIPGARRSSTVARIVPARMIELIADAVTPAVHRSVPVPGENVNGRGDGRSEEHTSELQSHVNLVCRLLLEKKKKQTDK